MHLPPLNLFLTLLAGIIPPLIWLKLWLKEDVHPEPRRLILTAFIGGMIAVPFVIPLQGFVKGAVANAVTVVILWALIEETLKFLAGYYTAMTKKVNNEPIDPVMFMLTAALGFAALENVLFIINPAMVGDLYTGLITSNLRFVGATLVHLVCSSAVGISLGLAFYKSRASKLLHLVAGILIATALHSTFNLLIMNATGMSTFGIFFGVWVSVIVLALFFEKVKRVEPTE
ncbi:MAG: PrsW family glutamic-type intramembrane protease [Patescibacteria group bacterium]